MNYSSTNPCDVHISFNISPHELKTVKFHNVTSFNYVNNNPEYLGCFICKVVKFTVQCDNDTDFYVKYDEALNKYLCNKHFFNTFFFVCTVLLLTAISLCTGVGF